MNYTENFDGIKLDVQAVDITISDTVQQEIRGYAGAPALPYFRNQLGRCLSGR
jgi:hypothetical protein